MGDRFVPPSIDIGLALIPALGVILVFTGNYGPAVALLAMAIVFLLIRILGNSRGWW